MIYTVLVVLILVAFGAGFVVLTLSDPDFGFRFKDSSESLKFWKDRIPLNLKEDQPHEQSEN